MGYINMDRNQRYAAPGGSTSLVYWQINYYCVPLILYFII